MLNEDDYKKATFLSDMHKHLKFTGNSDNDHFALARCAGGLLPQHILKYVSSYFFRLIDVLHSLSVVVSLMLVWVISKIDIRRKKSFCIRLMIILLCTTFGFFLSLVSFLGRSCRKWGSVIG
jgi:hypothetical protein